MSIGDAVATKFDIFGDGAELEDGPVPAVDPADLRSVWAMQKGGYEANVSRFPQCACRGDGRWHAARAMVGQRPE
jgi:hypothetical protein